MHLYRTKKMTTEESSTDKDDARFMRAKDHGFSGFEHSTEATWKGDFTFVQLADSQV